MKTQLPQFPLPWEITTPSPLPIKELPLPWGPTVTQIERSLKQMRTSTRRLREWRALRTPVAWEPATMTIRSCTEMRAQTFGCQVAALLRTWLNLSKEFKFVTLPLTYEQVINLQPLVKVAWLLKEKATVLPLQFESPKTSRCAVY